MRLREYGDWRDPEMHDFPQCISPANNAEEISKPLQVIQGGFPMVPIFSASG